MTLEVTPEQRIRGWVVRSDTQFSDEILVRGAMKTDHPVDYNNGFVYAETQDEAELYDIAHKYTMPFGVNPKTGHTYLLEDFEARVKYENELDRAMIIAALNETKSTTKEEVA